MVRAASGVLSARPSQIFQSTDRTPGSGQHGGLSILRVPAPLLAGCRRRHPLIFPRWRRSRRHYHLPVFPAEMAEWMEAGPGKFIIDGTLGGGGHSEMFPQGRRHACSASTAIRRLSRTRARASRNSASAFPRGRGTFRNSGKFPRSSRGERADGLLLDLGVSSRQLDSAARGFSFMREGPLDMRMGPSSPRTAADVVNEWCEADLSRIFFEFGEEPRARRIAAAIVKQRAVEAIRNHHSNSPPALRRPSAATAAPIRRPARSRPSGWR